MPHVFTEIDGFRVTTDVTSGMKKIAELFKKSGKGSSRASLTGGGGTYSK